MYLRRYLNEIYTLPPPERPLFLPLKVTARHDAPKPAACPGPAINYEIYDARLNAQHPAQPVSASNASTLDGGSSLVQHRRITVALASRNAFPVHYHGDLLLRRHRRPCAHESLLRRFQPITIDSREILELIRTSIYLTTMARTCSNAATAR